MFKYADAAVPCQLGAGGCLVFVKARAHALRSLPLLSPLPPPPTPPQHMSVPQLIDTILINPTVHVAPSYRDTGAQLGGEGRGVVAVRAASSFPFPKPSSPRSSPRPSLPRPERHLLL